MHNEIDGGKMSVGILLRTIGKRRQIGTGTIAVMHTSYTVIQNIFATQINVTQIGTAIHIHSPVTFIGIFF